VIPDDNTAKITLGERNIKELRKCPLAVNTVGRTISLTFQKTLIIN
jgi:hypothetical protein